MSKKYIYANLTIKNSSFFKRLSHNSRFKKALEIVEPNKSDSLLDFGTGDGYFLTLLDEKVDVNITGYEPISDMFEQLENTISNKEIVLIKNLKQADKDFNIIYCLEVLEHFSKENQAILLKQIKGKLKQNGSIIVSVPIEVGIASFVKNLIRISIKQLERDTNWKNILKALFFKAVERTEKDNYIFTHIGFNYKKLEEVFVEENLIIIKKEYSPFKILKNLNSQVFYELKNHN